jgi:hypothetical protein
MSDEGKNIRDEELDKVSGGRGADPNVIVERPITIPPQHGAPGIHGDPPIKPD